MARFLFTVWPITGHVYPQVAIAQALRERGHECALFTGERVASTSNRNFVGRQGKGARTHLVSPAMAAAAAVTGAFTDVRALLQE